MSSAFTACAFTLFLSGVVGQQVVYGTNNYVEYHRGNLKVILSVPHGGSVKPDSVPLRPPAGCFDYQYNDCVWTPNCEPTDRTKCEAKVSASDGYTQHLARELSAELENIYGVGNKPHIIFSNLYRDRLDANRHIDEATFGDPQAAQAFKEYHSFIEEAMVSVGGRGLYIDVHGQSQASNFTHIGMLLEADVLNQQRIPDHLAVESSLKNLFFRSGLSLEEIIRGPSSFGGQIEAAGYKVVPSPKNPSPGTIRYYQGGYNVRRYAGGLIDTIQIETHGTIRKDNKLRKKYAADLARIIAYYLDRFYY